MDIVTDFIITCRCRISQHIYVHHTILAEFNCICLCTHTPISSEWKRVGGLDDVHTIALHIFQNFISYFNLHALEAKTSTKCAHFSYFFIHFRLCLISMYFVRCHLVTGWCCVCVCVCMCPRVSHIFYDTLSDLLYVQNHFIKSYYCIYFLYFHFFSLFSLVAILCFSLISAWVIYFSLSIFFLSSPLPLPLAITLLYFNLVKSSSMRRRKTNNPYTAFALSLLFFRCASNAENYEWRTSRKRNEKEEEKK